MSEVHIACPWCGSDRPTIRRFRFPGVRCASAWHSDHLGFIARYGDTEREDAEPHDIEAPSQFGRTQTEDST